MGWWRERVPGSGKYELSATRSGSKGKRLSPKTKTIEVTKKMSDARLHKFLDMEAEKWQQEVDNGIFLDGSKLSFEDLSERWMKDYAEKHLQPKTIARYKDCLWRINQALGHIKLDKFQAHHLNSFYSNLAEKGVRRDGSYYLNPQYYEQIKADKHTIALSANVNVRTLSNLLKGKSTLLDTAEKVATGLGQTVNKSFQLRDGQTGLHPDTILKHARLIHTILNRALKWQLISTNVADIAEPPKSVKTEVACYDEEEVIRLLEAIRNEPLKFQVAVHLGVYCGLRVGECCGLEWSDINFDKGTLRVNRSRQQIPGMESFDKAPKTEQGKRSMTVPQAALSILQSHRKEQEQTRRELGDKWIESGKVLTQWNGLPMNPQAPSHWLNKWLKSNRFPHTTFHGLRHSNISLLIAGGLDIVTIAKRAGHVKTSTTGDMYGHLFKSRDRAAANILDDMVASKLRPVSE